jgi:predicted acetyltransferase
MREEGLYLSVLDPFYAPFYEKFGYALAEDRYQHTIPSQEFRLIEPNPEISVKELEDSSETQTVLKVERTMARFGSRAFHTSRSLSRYIKENHFHVLERGKTPVGAVKFHFKGHELENEYRLNLEVFLCAFTSWDVFPSIMRLVAQYATNVKTVTWYGCDPQIPIRQYLKDLWKIRSERKGSMMMRIIDFERYCPQITLEETASQAVVMKIKDEYCPWNEGTYLVKPEGGQLSAEKTSDSPEITLDALQLSKVVSGLTPATLLHELGEIQCSRDTAERLAAIWPADIFITYQRF